MHTTLITGVNGFVGHHLAREMHEQGYEVIGTSRSKDLDASLKPVVSRYLSADLTDPNAASELPLEACDSVINLAGLANVGASFDNPDLYKKVNVQTLSNICALLLEKGLHRTRVLAISTGGVYDQDNRLPQTEASKTFSLSVKNPYIVSKLLMEQAAADFRAQGLDVIVVRPFNHIGPGQLQGYLVPDLAAKIKAAKGSGEKLAITKLEHKRRDFTDVRDVVRAYRLLACAEPKQLHYELYNVCSGRSTSAKYILDLLLKEMGVEDLELTSSQPSFGRPVDPDDLYGDYTRLHADTGWEPQIPIEQTIKDFVVNL